jgi:hypothetical protein
VGAVYSGKETQNYILRSHTALKENCSISLFLPTYNVVWGQQCGRWKIDPKILPFFPSAPTACQVLCKTSKVTTKNN